MNMMVEGQNQKLVTEHLQQGYELVHTEITKAGMVYLLGKEITLGDKIDIIVVREGKVNFNSEMSQQQIAMLAASIKNTQNQ
jgi:hypothetical protein